MGRYCLAIALAAFGWIAALAESARADQDKPNFLVLVSDDQRPDTFAALGNSYIETPHLDSLARSGTAFRRMVCANPICTPSRAEILSGCDGFRNGTLDFGHPIDPELTLWPEAMGDGGYRTWYVGKWHNDGRPTTRGYDATRGLFAGGGGRWWKDQTDWKGRPITGYRGWIFQTDDGTKLPEKGVGLTADISARFADAAIEFLEQPSDRPFFLHVNFTAPHDPLIMPPGFDGMYRPETMPLPANFRGEHPFDHGNFDGRDEQLLPWPRAPDDVREELAYYYAVISHMDQQVGRILEALERSGQSENTYVIFTSDHGLAIGSHGLRGKQSMYEHTINVPFLIRGPDIAGGRETRAQAYLREVYPTVCELAGIETPQTVQGESFAGVLRGQTDRHHEYVFGYFRDKQRMIRGERWKLIEYPQVGQQQLFDLESDPHELDNRIDDPAAAEVREQLSRRLKQWQDNVGDPVADSW